MRRHSDEIITQTTGSDEQGRGYVVDVLRKPRAEEVTRHEFYMSTPGDEETYQAPPTDGNYANYEPIKKDPEGEQSTSLVPRNLKPALSDEERRHQAFRTMDSEAASRRNFQAHLESKDRPSETTARTRVIRLAIAALIAGGLSLFALPKLKNPSAKASSNFSVQSK